MGKKYRKNVAAVILSHTYPNERKIFIAKRIDMRKVWQFPQGGIDEGETPQSALFRELKEEIGTDEIEVLSEYPDWLSYDFPEFSLKKRYNYDGQTQKYFLVRLLPSAIVNIKTPEPEFSEFLFIDANDVLDKLAHFKLPIYKKVISYFQQEGFL